jgi:GNAT superfamily N-acetyltransferase
MLVVLELSAPVAAPAAGERAKPKPAGVGASFVVRRLRPEGAAALVTLRREALEAAPLAFAASLDDDHALSIDRVRAFLADDHEQAVFGCPDRDELTGMVGVARASKTKQRHTAIVWGMHVTSRARRRGAGRALLAARDQRPDHVEPSRVGSAACG